MFAHVSIGVSDIAQSISIYDQLMECLGYARLFGSLDEEFMAYGPEDSFFIINTPLNPERGSAHGSNGSHVCLRAPSTESVDRFFETACALGLTADGSPGIRSEYAEDYYAAFILDLDGNKIEVVSHSH